jgi:hypothetical protein
MRHLRFFLATTLLAAALIPSTATAQNTGAAAVQLPSGTYLIVLGEADSVPRELVGEVRLVIDNSGGYRLLRNNNEVVVGKYTVEGNRLTLVDLSGQMACRDTEPAIYTWKVTDAGLVLEAVTDACLGRRRINTLRPMTKVKAD